MSVIDRGDEFDNANQRFAAPAFVITRQGGEGPGRFVSPPWLGSDPREESPS